MDGFPLDGSTRHRRHLDAMERRVREVCADAVGTDELIDGLVDPLSDGLGLSGVVLGATDPGTVLASTATRVAHLPHAMAVPWMHNEFLEDDFNKFAGLHRAHAQASTLHRATQNSPMLSTRYRLNRTVGFGPELRTTFSTGNNCWGIINGVRTAHDDDFEESSLESLDRVNPVIAGALRRSMTVEASSATPGAAGVVTLDSDGRLLSMTPSAMDLLEELWMCPIKGLDHSLPGEAFMVATLARAHADGRSTGQPAMTRLRGKSGRWLTLRGEQSLDAEGLLTGLVLVVEPSLPSEVLPLVVASSGMTAREEDVFTELANGCSTQDIAARLFISEHTVRDHLKSIFAKTGTSSRGELLSMLVVGQ